MHARIISVGTELLADKQDTNGPELARALAARGLELRCRYVLADDRDELAECIRRALEERGLVVLSGGLGPTLDDLTRQAACDATGLQLA